jgi:hypothetical protein
VLWLICGENIYAAYFSANGVPIPIDPSAFGVPKVQNTKKRPHMDIDDDPSPKRHSEGKRLVQSQTSHHHASQTHMVTPTLISFIVHITFFSLDNVSILSTNATISEIIEIYPYFPHWHPLPHIFFIKCIQNIHIR